MAVLSGKLQYGLILNGVETKGRDIDLGYYIPVGRKMSRTKALRRAGKVRHEERRFGHIFDIEHNRQGQNPNACSN